MDPEFLNSQLAILTEAKVITEPEQNLRSKIDSLLRSIENLTSKKLRLEYEIKKQKRSLTRKRLELKKSSKHFKVELESALDRGLLSETSEKIQVPWTSIDDYLLQESARVLDD